jgi:MFS superfamily sulfate permease-like transporter
VLWGIGIAVILAILLFFHRNWWPQGAVLGQVDEVPGWHSLDAYPDARQLPGVVVYRWEAPLFFANSSSFRRKVRRLAGDFRPSWIVLQCEAITDIDVTAAEMLELLDKELNAIGVHLAFVELRSRLQDLVLLYGLFDTLDRTHFYPTLKTALEDIQAHGPPRGEGA